IPAIAFGSGSVNKDKDASDLVSQAIETGFSHIDTAQAYRNEESVGVAIRESGLSREDLYITTKYSRPGPISEAARNSLDKLGLKFVDLYLIHVPSLVEHDLEGSWREFEKIKQDGLARSIGVSNFNLEQLQTIVKIAHIKPAVNQIQFNPYTYAQHKPLLEYAAKHDIVVEAYSSLAYVSFYHRVLYQANWSIYSPITKFPGGPVDAVVNAVAKRHGISPDQVIFLWVRAKGAVIVT
ncbi:hypothetical protein H0H93_013583, partial [Arthromyces matolae]